MHCLDALLFVLGSEGDAMAKSRLESTRAYCNSLKNRSSYSTIQSGCKADFDNSLCWEEAPLDFVVGQTCPFEFCSGCPISPEGESYVDLKFTYVIIAVQECKSGLENSISHALSRHMSPSIIPPLPRLAYIVFQVY